MKSLKLPSMLVILLFISGAAAASPLYSWTTKDGTPTYSTDPPPKGVSYEIVGPDLQPLKGQPVNPATAAALPKSTAPASDSAVAENVVLTPAPGSNTTAVKKKSSQPRAKWKPVIYADDPNPNSAKPEINTAAAIPQAAPAVNKISEECLGVRQKLLLLESEFANAITAKQMDDAVVQLSVFRKENQGNCGL